MTSFIQANGYTLHVVAMGVNRIGKLYTMREVAARLHKSLRWLQTHISAHPCGRMVGRSRLFTEDDFAQLVASFPADGEQPGRRRRAVPVTITFNQRAQKKAVEEAIWLATGGKSGRSPHADMDELRALVSKGKRQGSQSKGKVKK